MCILNQRDVAIHNRVIDSVKVQWKHFGTNEVTSKMVEPMRVSY